MSKIGSKNTKPELIAFKILTNNHVPFKKHYSKIPGKPDIAFPRRKIAVFINGEFWHGRRFKEEKEKYPEFWVNKIKSNIIRDRKNYRLLRQAGWKVLIIWDKALIKNPDKEVSRIVREYTNRVKPKT